MGLGRLSQMWVQGPEGWCKRRVGGMEDLHCAVQKACGAPMGAWWLVCGGRVLREEEQEVYKGDQM